MCVLGKSLTLFEQHFSLGWRGLERAGEVCVCVCLRMREGESEVRRRGSRAEGAAQLSKLT